MRNYYKAGEWNTICDDCGFKFKSGDLRKRWDGLMVCDQDFELRNPQDLIRIPKDDPSVSWVRPESTDTFILWDILLEDGSASLAAEDGAILEWA